MRREEGGREEGGKEEGGGRRELKERLNKGSFNSRAAGRGRVEGTFGGTLASTLWLLGSPWIPFGTGPTNNQTHWFSIGFGVL